MNEHHERHERRRVRMAGLGLVVHDSRVLLVAHGYAQHWWGLPGGAVDPGEAADRCAVREVAEETGLEVVSDGLVAIADRGELFMFVYRCSLVAPDPELVLRPGEITDARWCDLDDLDELEPHTFGIAIHLGRSVINTAPLSSPGLFQPVTVHDPDGADVRVEHAR